MRYTKIFTIDMPNKSNKKFAKFEDLILSFINNPDLLSPRKQNSLSAMKKKFDNFTSITDSVFEELVTLSNNDPQLIINLIRETFTLEIFTTVITTIKKEVETITDKMNVIAMTWEISSFFKLSAYLISGCRAPIESLSEHSSIFKYFKAFGLTSSDIDKIRLVRNAKNHKFTISKGFLIFYDNGNEIQISTPDIERVYDYLEDISSWWLTFIFYHILYIPQFGILFCYSVIEKMLSDKIRIKNYVDGLKDFVPDDILNQKVELSVKERIKKSYRKAKIKIKRIKYKIVYKDNYKSFFLTHGNYILKRVAYHFESISSNLDKIYNSLHNVNDKENFLRISNWLKENSDTIKNISDNELNSLIIQHYN